MIRDRNIEWARQRDWIGVYDMNGWITKAEAGVSMDGTGTMNELTTAMNVMVAPHANDDRIHHTMLFPSYWSIAHEIGISAYWVSDSNLTNGETCQYEVEYALTPIDTSSLLNDLDLETGTALNTVIASQTVTTAGGLAALKPYRSARGIINANVITEAQMDGFIHFRIQRLGGTVGADEGALLGIAIDYYPHWCVGGQNTEEEDRVNGGAA